MLTGLRRQGPGPDEDLPRMPNKTYGKQGLVIPYRVSQAAKGLLVIQQEPPRELKKVTQKPRLLSQALPFL